ncbi:MAG: hypothetical protein H0Z18_08150 [Thermococcus sp.]|uniref:hypothetical protein n=1 Tax=Thermococcus sp. TaxID=35749 RepID=UPI001DDD5270|nr:hypothetical protein [Thermococcus sp.]MBO8175215.1 hypothetical protein [Thermococcus sp.]
MPEKSVLVEILEKGGVLLAAGKIGDIMGQSAFNCCVCPYRDECEAFSEATSDWNSDFSEWCYVEGCPHADEAVVVIAGHLGSFIVATVSDKLLDTIQEEWKKIKAKREEAEKASSNSSSSSSEVKA